MGAEEREKERERERDRERDRERQRESVKEGTYARMGREAAWGGVGGGTSKNMLISHPKITRTPPQLGSTLRTSVSSAATAALGYLTAMIMCTGASGLAGPAATHPSGSLPLCCSWRTGAAKV